MSKIQKIHARQILDSRGNPTIQVELTTKKGKVSAMVPSGASTGEDEALELRDNKKEYNGKSVKKAINNINKIIAPMLKGESVLDQENIDVIMIRKDSTPNKRKLGANAILAVSMAIMRAAALENNIELYQYIAKKLKTKNYILPIPYANVINGGVHAGNDLEFQEFMIVPVGAKSFTEATQMISETYHKIKTILEKKFGKEATNVGDEGGFAPPIKKPEQALDILVQAIEDAGYTGKIKIAIDVAASEYYNKGRYFRKKFKGEKLIKYYDKLLNKYPIISIEDPFDQNDFDIWKIFTSLNSKKYQIVGDDLTVTNPAKVQFAADQKLCNSLLLKINQIGTISEALFAAECAIGSGWNVMVSHRSGETEDPFIADLAVGLGCGQLKLGAPCRSDRTSKYNRLLKIEDDLGKKAKFNKII